MKEYVEGNQRARQLCTNTVLSDLNIHRYTIKLRFLNHMQMIVELLIDTTHIATILMKKLKSCVNDSHTT